MTTSQPTRRPASAADKRCPACGQPIDGDAGGACPLCGHQLAAAHTTTDDATPYAQVEHPGWRAWFSTCVWLFGAGSQRLALVALTGRTPASTRFFRRALLVFAVAAALFSATQFGWQRVMVGPGAPGTENSEPNNKGWISVAFAPPDGTEAYRHPVPAALWWSLPQTVLAASAAFATAMLVGWLMLRVIGGGSEKALAEQYRGQGRLAGALRYGAGWGLWLLAAAFVSLLLPFCNAAEVKRWAFAPSLGTIYLAAALIASVGLLMAWFWLIRAAGTSPPATRARLVLFHAVGTPLIAGGIIAGWWTGLVYGLRPVMSALGLQW